MALGDLSKLANFKALRDLTKATTKAERDEIFRRRQQVFDLNLSPLGQANRLPPIDEIDPAFFETKGDTKVVRAPMVEPTGTIPEEVPPITLADLEGRAIVSSMSDRSAAGGILTGVEGTQFPYPVNLTGGQGYMFENAPNVWASAEAPSNLIFKRAQQAAEMTGETPVLAPFQMGPKGIDFASMTGEAMIAQSAAIMPAGSKRALNRDIKNFIPDWKGVDDPASLDQYAAAPKTARDGIRNLISVKYGNEGGAREAQGRISATDPEQLGIAPKTSFLNVGEIDVTGQVDPTGGNVTYPAAIPGRGLGRLDTDATLADLLKSEVDLINAPDPVKALQQFERSAQLSPRIIPITEELLTDLQGRGFKIQANPVATAVGTVMALTALTPEEAEASLAKLAERGYKIDRNPTSADPGNESADFFVYEGDGGPGSKFVGKASMSQWMDETLRSDDTEIAQKLRGLGIGGEMYDAIGEMTGLVVQPSEHLTADGAGFWVKRDPELMQRLFDEGYFDDAVEDTVETALNARNYQPPPMRSVFPAPQRFFDPNDKSYKPFTAPFGPTPGGRYLTREGDQFVDITGETVDNAILSVGPDGKPQFLVGEKYSPLPAEGKGRKIKTNLFKKKAGWNWTQVPDGYNPNPDGNFPLISVEDGKNHYYTLETVFPEGVDLARYEQSKTEPRLRPTKEKSTVTLGEKVGEISVRGKLHPVYSSAVVRFGLPAVVGAGALGGTEEAEAARFGPITGFGNKPQQVAEKIVRQKPGPINSFLNELDKFGVKESELDAMGIREHFAGRQDVTRQEVIDFINTNPYQIYEDMLVDPTTTALDYFRILEPEALAPMKDALARGSIEDADKIFAELKERHQLEMKENVAPRWANTEYDLVLPGERTNDMEIIFQYPSARLRLNEKRKELLPAIREAEEVQSSMDNWVSNADILRNSGYVFSESDNPVDVMKNILSSPELGRFAMSPEELSGRTPEQLDDLVVQAIKKADKYTRMSPLDFAPEYDPSVAPAVQEIKRLDKLFRESDDISFVDQAHYPDHPNPVMHMRLNERSVFTKDGDKGAYQGESLHIDELQSDLHQTARDTGYRGPENDAKLEAARTELAVLEAEAQRLHEEFREFRGGYRKEGLYAAVRDAQGEEVAEAMLKDLEQRTQDAYTKARRKEGDIRKLEQAPPNVPLQGNWYELGLKKALINAANTDDLDFITLTQGREQAIRSRQLKTFDNVSVMPSGDSYEIILYKDGNEIVSRNTDPGARIDTELVRFLGKDNAIEIMTDPQTGQLRSADDFTGFDGQLKGETGGEGMYQYYDKTYVNKLNKMVKRYGAKVETFYVQGDGTNTDSLIPVHGIRLNDEIREAIRADRDSGSFTAFMHPGTVATAGVGGAAMVAPGGEAEARTVRPEPPELLRRPDADTPPADAPPRAPQRAPRSPLDQVGGFKPAVDLTEIATGVIGDLAEESVKFLAGSIASVIDPSRNAENKSRLDRVLESEEIIKDGPQYKQFKEGVGEVFDEFVTPAIRKALITETPIRAGGLAGIALQGDASIPGTALSDAGDASVADQAAAVAELYNQMPEGVRKEILSRLGYAGLSILAAYGIKDFGLGRSAVRDSVQALPSPLSQASEVRANAS